MSRHGCSSVKKAGVYSLILVFALFIVSPSIALAELSGSALSSAKDAAAKAGARAAKSAAASGATSTEAASAAATAAANTMAAAGASAAQVKMAATAAAEGASAAKAAATAGAKVGKATKLSLTKGTIATGILVAAAIAGIAVTSGGEDWVGVPQPTPAEIVDEAIDDVFEATTDEEQEALGTLLLNQTEEENAAYEDFIEVLTTEDLDQVQEALAVVEDAVDMQAVLDALADDAILTRGRADLDSRLWPAYDALAALGEANAPALQAFNTWFETVKDTNPDQLHGKFKENKELLSELSDTGLQAVQDMFESGDVALVLEQLEEDLADKGIDITPIPDHVPSTHDPIVHHPVVHH